MSPGTMPKHYETSSEDEDVRDLRASKRRKVTEDSPIYHPLDSANLEIRLLHVKTASKGRTSRIECRLEHVLLSQDPPPMYEAISWCWGDATPAKEVLLDGKVRLISVNAEEVIRSLCFDQGHAIVWLDAVCIDQSNIQERGEQVAIMKDVYSRAEKVLIWLGGDDDGSAQAAFESIDKLLVQCREETDNIRNLRSTFYNSQGIWVDSDIQLPECDWTALKTFFSAPLFSRLWVIQEIMLSRQARCFRDRFSRSWTDVSLAAQWLLHRKYWRGAHMDGSVDGVENAASIWRQTNVNTYLAEWLAYSSYFHASLPLDKIYGLLGLMQKNVSGALELTPDYNARVDVVYTTATRLAIDELAGSADWLFILQYAQFSVPPREEEPDECDQTPSWVPRYDWKYDLRRSPRVILPFGDGAANGMPGTVREHDPGSPRVLTVKGVVISYVAWRSSLLSAAMLSKDGFVYELAKELLSCISAAQDQGHPDEAIAVALTARVNTLHNDALEDVDFVGTYRKYMTWCKEMSGKKQNGKTSSQDIPEAVFDYRQALRYGSRNCVFFTTASGHMGLGPPGMETKDVICILFGSRVPFVLREEKNGRWRLLGAAYVHDTMEGEYIRQLQEQGRLEEETRWFDIE